MYKNAKFEEIQNLFDITQKLIWDHQGEILNVKPIGSTDPSWTRSTLSHDQVIQWAKARVIVYSDGVCPWENLQKQIEDGKDKWRNFDGVLLAENYWALMQNQLNWSGIFSQDIPHGRFVQKIQNDLQERNIEPEQFGDRIIFMSVFNDIDWTTKGNGEKCISNSEKAHAHAERFSQGHWTFLGPGSEEMVNRMQQQT